MQSKLIYIVDAGKLAKQAYIATLLAADNSAQTEVLAGCSAPVTPVLMGLLDGANVMASNPQHWGNDSLEAAHTWLADHFAEVVDGQIVDAGQIIAANNPQA